MAPILAAVVGLAPPLLDINLRGEEIDQEGCVAPSIHISLQYTEVIICLQSQSTCTGPAHDKTHHLDTVQLITQTRARKQAHCFDRGGVTQ